MNKLNALLIAGLLFPAISFASDPKPPSEAEIQAAAIAVTKNYANAVACTEDEYGIWSFLTLQPWTDYYAREDAEFAVIWSGDVGCAGGSGTVGVNLAIVKVGAGNSYYVDARDSSPPAEFEFYSRSFESVVANTSDVIVLEAFEHGRDDANCCPSLRVRYTLKRDENRDWKLHQRQEI
ncbi:hypothetical protein HG264_05560 [Pseudomonas sp. gcc21]|uniref:hypothetical protein n=1 Tax=Pseudomonas sp. gcc21 TaxID=2726989 RepID=UPI0014514869|nr:hypothetical protein [Pseudomonas sp. gcc21]QJD58412.1 hypothetical protein HG264_05560 [Pseudomonas sp. gcc21]